MEWGHSIVVLRRLLQAGLFLISSGVGSATNVTKLFCGKNSEPIVDSTLYCGSVYLTSVLICDIAA
jgi:hypothetical protein